MSGDRGYLTPLDDDSGHVAHINITPLADVMLVLLIIFMITAPLSAHRIRVALPDTGLAPTSGHQPARPIDLAVARDGALFLDGVPVPAAQLTTRLRDLAGRDPGRPINIRADRHVRFQRVRRVLEAARDSGMAHVRLVTRAAADGPVHDGSAGR